VESLGNDYLKVYMNQSINKRLWIIDQVTMSLVIALIISQEYIQKRYFKDTFFLKVKAILDEMLRSPTQNL